MKSLIGIVIIPGIQYLGLIGHYMNYIGQMYLYILLLCYGKSYYIIDLRDILVVLTGRVVTPRIQYLGLTDHYMKYIGQMCFIYNYYVMVSLTIVIIYLHGNIIHCFLLALGTVVWIYRYINSWPWISTGNVVRPRIPLLLALGNPKHSVFPKWVKE